MRDDIVYKLEGVVKCYGPREVCRIQQLDIARGEVLGIMGPSGAGKSTLLRLLNFLEPATSGFITFGGFHYNSGGLPPLELRRRVTMVFQQPVLLSTSVRENVAYGLKLRGWPGVWPRVEAALKRVDLLPLARVRVSTLSGGELQRVALARALVLEPEVLLLDEPTANLDPYNVALVEGLVREINREQGTTIVLVTHNVFQARRLAQRVVFLLEGRVVEVGRTEEVFSQPRDPRTGAFIRGEMVY